MKRFFAVATVAALLLSGQAFAGYSFDDISESSPTGDAPPLTFGLPPDIVQSGIQTIAVFDPTGFASSTNGIGSDFTDGRLQFTINANNGSVISLVDFREAGGYEIINGGRVSYSLTVSPTIRAIDGSPAFIPLDLVTVSGEKNAQGVGSWELTLSYDMAAAAAAKGITGGVTSVEFEIDDRLSSQGTGAAAGAFIDKKDFSVAVPEPSSFLFLGLVCSGAMVWQKKRRFDLIEA